MKPPKVFWTGILFLVVLAVGGCAQLATQQKVASPSAQKAASAPQEEEQKEKLE